MTTTGAAAVSAAALGGVAHAARDYKISLAAWSLHRAVFGKEMLNVDMPTRTRQEWDIEGLELVSTMFAPEHEKSFGDMKPYLDKLAKNASDNNVKLLLIMIDGEGEIGAEEKDARKDAVTRHKKWLDVCEYLGCHSMRMNWHGAPREIVSDAKGLEEFVKRSEPGFAELCDYAAKKKLDVLIENHGGASSDPAAMEKLFAAVKHPNFGTLPDFGNFPQGVDIYDGIDRLMKFALKAVSAKCHDFDDTTGEETKMDYGRLIANVVDTHNYHGFIGIEYEGERLSEAEGIKRCKALLDKLKA